MEDNVKVIDLLDLTRYLYSCKTIIVGCTIIGGLAGFGLAYKTVTPTYQSSIDIRLPLYCDENTISTAVVAAKGKSLIDSVNAKMGIPEEPVKIIHDQSTGAKDNDETGIQEGEIGIIPSRVDKTSIIHVTIKGKNPQLIKKYADTYQKALVESLNSFINEKAVNDMVTANLQAVNPLPKEELINRMDLGKTEVIKEAGVPTARVDEGYHKKTIYGIILGLLISTGGCTLKYLKQVFLDSNVS